MRIISKATLEGYAKKHSDARSSLENWVNLIEAGTFGDFSSLKQSIGSVDVAGPSSMYHIFNIKGNDYRLVVAIHYNGRRVYIRDFQKHDVYESEPYKKKIREGRL